ncbi:hypothetical protein K437DRAFT_45028 [Tilletiaria anomala UBC 951]|uniref:cAMP-independent regulatory protein pac2 n=1 Tax=Tilletiaria anomala (strain ATCC 24038 / CBS 436.72 / UBC 951) TaxID=1037660 RepID=A0A066WE11_TILAU|nr:uncharacterized protein K437DRAFT_45028 [Tilletiaria anomala UBC 951]KDN51991.1 hypothetical protein K437DRAFT_45028 [Tilletiaria anomala UBC 951]
MPFRQQQPENDRDRPDPSQHPQQSYIMPAKQLQLQQDSDPSQQQQQRAHFSESMIQSYLPYSYPAMVPYNVPNTHSARVYDPPGTITPDTLSPGQAKRDGSHPQVSHSPNNQSLQAPPSTDDLPYLVLGLPSYNAVSIAPLAQGPGTDNPNNLAPPDIASPPNVAARSPLVPHTGHPAPAGFSPAHQPHHHEPSPSQLEQDSKCSATPIASDCRRSSTTQSISTEAPAAHSNLQPTYFGMIRTTADVIRLLAATDLPNGTPNNPPRRIMRRLLESERISLVRAGTVFAWDEKEAGMRRWTDGRCWSASRVSGCFLTYRELEVRKHRNGAPGGPTANQYKVDGLIKQSFSMITGSNRKMHVINYYTKRDLREETLRRVGQDPRFENIDGNGWPVEVDETEYPDPALDQQEDQGATSDDGPIVQSDNITGLVHRLSPVSSSSDGGHHVSAASVNGLTGTHGQMAGSGLVVPAFSINNRGDYSPGLSDGGSSQQFQPGNVYGSSRYPSSGHQHQYGAASNGGGSVGSANHDSSSRGSTRYQLLSQHEYQKGRERSLPQLSRPHHFVPHDIRIGSGVSRIAGAANGDAHGDGSVSSGVHVDHDARANHREVAKMVDVYTEQSAYSMTPLGEAKGLLPIEPIPVKSGHFISNNAQQLGLMHVGNDASARLHTEYPRLPAHKRPVVDKSLSPESRPGTAGSASSGASLISVLSLSYLPPLLLPSLSPSRSKNSFAFRRREPLIRPVHSKRFKYDTPAVGSSEGSGSESDGYNLPTNLPLPPPRRPPLRRLRISSFSYAHGAGDSGENSSSGSSYRSSTTTASHDSIPSAESSHGGSRGSDGPAWEDRISARPSTPADGAASVLPRLLRLDSGVHAHSGTTMSVSISEQESAVGALLSLSSNGSAPASASSAFGGGSNDNDNRLNSGHNAGENAAYRSSDSSSIGSIGDNMMTQGLAAALSIAALSGSAVEVPPLSKMSSGLDAADSAALSKLAVRL